jgi:hypothetical protein
MDLVIPLIEESLQPPAKDFFEEDGIELWVMIAELSAKIAYDSDGKRVCTTPHHHISPHGRPVLYVCCLV